MRIIFVRHGEPDYIHDCLTDKGRIQALSAAERLREEGISEIGPKFFEDIFTPAIKKAEENDIPLYCGEHGVIDLADKEDAIRWIRDIHSAFHKFGIGSALWNYKGMNYGISDLKNVRIREALREVL